MEGMKSPTKKSRAGNLTEQLVVRMTASERAALQRTAEAEDRPQSAVVRRAVRRYVSSLSGTQREPAEAPREASGGEA